MKELISNFSKQLREAREIADQAVLTEPENPVHNVLLLGMGGSAFGGEVTRDYTAGQCTVPFDINRDYEIPGYVSPNTLIIASSYSGNTEETLAGFEVAKAKGAKIVCVTSGGKILAAAKELGLDHIVLPGGNPPRTAAGYSIVQQLRILHHFGLINDYDADLEESIALLENFDDHNLAKELGAKMKGRLPILYTAAGFESQVIRWRQQIEENSKQLAFYHIVPEMNHNELVGWRHPEDILAQSAVVFLESNLQHPRNHKRMEITKALISKWAHTLTSVQAKGDSKLAQLFYYLHLGDWVSFYLAEMNNEDPMPVKVIDFLKEKLAKL